jgi:hypothetical protein
MKIVLYLFFLVVLLIGSLSFKEGFETGTYAYLAPSDPISLDETTKNNLIAAGKKTAAVLFPEFIFTNEKINQIKNQMNQINDVTLDEVNYYIQYNKWPYGSYVSNFLNTNKESLLEKMKGSKFKSLDDLQKVFPTRGIYKYLIEHMEPPPSLANDIYMGRKPPPNESVPEKETPVPTIRPPFSSDSYSKLETLCATLK